MQQNPLIPNKLAAYQVELNQITQADLEQVRAWRNDPNVAKYMLSQQEISQEQQQAWFQKICRDPSQVHFMIVYKSQAIGVANIRAFYQGEDVSNARVIEPGLYIGHEKYRNNLLAFAPTLVLNDYCFETLKVESLKAVVKADNQAALNYNQKIGYTVDKQAELVEISLIDSNYQQSTKVLKSLLSRPAKK